MNIYDKKYQIFVSSTYTDLIKAREEVIKVILSLYQIPIGMEMFSADNDEQWSIIQSTIDNSDYYLLIIGHRYGSLTKEKISYTEKEFDYAKAIGVPIISFIRNREIATMPSERDEDPSKHELLLRFLEKVQYNSMCDFWVNENELGQKVAISLTKMFFKTPRIGWIKANRSNTIETAEELTKLIQENRELREELGNLKSKVLNEKPKLEVKICNTNEIQLTWKESHFSNLMPIIRSQISEEFLKYISDESIEKFNNELKKKEEIIENYKREYNVYDNAVNNFRDISIEVLNNGNRKATDIYIDIIFPKEVVVYEQGEKARIDLPKLPEIIENPLTVAKRVQYKKSEEGKYVSVLGTNIISGTAINPRVIRSLNVNKNYWINVNKNTLTIKLSKLTHTRTFTLKDDIVIAPLKKGCFQYLISIICDEYNSKEDLISQIIIK